MDVPCLPLDTDRYVSVWDMASGSLMKQCHHTHRIMAICLSKSERYLATLDVRHELHLWDMLSMASKRDATVPLMSHQLKVGHCHTHPLLI